MDHYFLLFTFYFFQVIIHEPKTKVDLTKYLENGMFRSVLFLYDYNYHAHSLPSSFVSSTINVTFEHTILNLSKVKLFLSVLRSRSRNYLGPGAGAEIQFLINIFCCQFGGC